MKSHTKQLEKWNKLLKVDFFQTISSQWMNVLTTCHKHRYPSIHPLDHSSLPASILSRMFNGLRFRLCLRDPFLSMRKPRQMYLEGTFYDCFRLKRLTLTLLTAFPAAPVPHGCFASQLASRANWKNRVPNRFSRKQRIRVVFLKFSNIFDGGRTKRGGL